MNPTVPSSRQAQAATPARFDRDEVKGALADELARRERQSIAVSLAGLAVFAALDWSAGSPHQLGLLLIKLVLALGLGGTALVLAHTDRRRTVLGAGQFSLALLYLGTAVSGVLIGDFTTPPLQFSILAIGSAAFIPWGLRAHALSMVPASLSALWLLTIAHFSGAALPPPTIGALALSLLVSVYIAAQTEGQRLVRIHFRNAERALAESEQRRAAVLAAAIDGIVVVDDDGAILEFNQAAERIFGVARDDAIGRPMVELLIPARFHDVYPKAHAEHLASGRSGSLGIGVEFPALRGDGSEFPAQFAVARSRWDDRPILVYQVRDLSGQRRTEDALRDSEARLKGFFDSATILLSLVEIDGDDFAYVAPNRRMAEFFRLPLEQFTGNTGRGVGLSEEQIHYWLAQLRRCAQSGPRRVSAYRFDWAGRTTWLEISLSPIGNPGEGPAQFSVVAVDITERRLAEEAVRSLNRDLEAKVRERTAQLEFANKELEAFAYTVSHDLRAPLRSIEGFADILVHEHGGQLDAEAATHLRRVRQAAKRMAELIDGLLALSRVVRGELRDESIDLSELAGEIGEEYGRRREGGRVDVIVQPGMTTRGDARLVRVVLENLIGNAFKYTGRRERARIEIGRTADERHGEFFVRDNGCGFDAAYGDKLFRAFSRLHDKGEYEGSGIGLATVARIARRHGGSVRAEGELDRGATFYFRLGSEGDAAERREAVSA